MKTIRTAVLALAIVAAPAAGQTQIGTISGGIDQWSAGLVGSDFASNLVGGGQLFNAPPGGFMYDFSFFASNFRGTGLTYRAFVGAWNGSAVSSVVWSSGDIAGGSFGNVGTIPAPLGDFTEVNLSVQRWLTPGARYLAYITPVGGTAGVGTADFLALRSRLESVGSLDGQGGLVRLDGTGSDPATAVWTPNALGYTNADAAFVANFAEVPEPASILLVASAMLALLWVHRRRETLERTPARRPKR